MREALLMMASVVLLGVAPGAPEKAETKPVYTKAIEQSGWVKQQIAIFSAQDYTKNRIAFQRAFAWGIGTYGGRPVEWFAYTNTDAYLQFNLSVRLTAADIEKVEQLRDGYQRNWSARIQTGHAPTWIGASNHWVRREGRCTGEYRECDTRAPVLAYLKQLKEGTAGRINLVPAEYFPYLPRLEK